MNGSTLHMRTRQDVTYHVRTRQDVTGLLDTIDGIIMRVTRHY